MTKKPEDDDEPNLEDMIRAAAANGELSHLSINPVAGKGPYGVVWNASYSPASKWGSGFGRDPDPIVALKQAMTDKRFGALVSQLRKVIDGGKPKFSAKDMANASAMNDSKSALPEEVDDSDFI